MALAIGHVDAGRVESALRIWEATEAAHAPNPAVLQLLAVLLLQRSDVAQARECIGASLAIRPVHGPSRLVAEDVARAAGDIEAALSHHRRAVELMPDRADA